MNRMKNIRILLGILLTLLFVKLISFSCITKTFTGLSCPFCGMTRSFYAILHFDFFEATYQNLLGIPLFIVLIFIIAMLIKEAIQNRFSFVPNLLHFLLRYCPLFITLLVISFVYNNLK